MSLARVFSKRSTDLRSTDIDVFGDMDAPPHGHTLGNNALTSSTVAQANEFVVFQVIHSLARRACD